MYKIIGADQREYGPVTAEQIHQWVAEGRANGATKVQVEGSTDWVPLSSLAEFADVLAAKAPPPPPVPSPLPSDPGQLAAYVLERDYDLDIGRCVSRSWALLKQNLGLLIGATVIFEVLMFVLNQVISLFTRQMMTSLMQGFLAPGPIIVILLWMVVASALSMVLMAGLYSILLKLIRGQPTGIGDLFLGFRANFVQLAAAGIVIPFLTFIGFLLCILPAIYLSVAWILAIPLIIDRELDFWAGMELSRKVVTRHWWLMFCMLVVMTLINFAGVLACCVGLFAAFPLGLGALMYAYEDIFNPAGPAAH